MTTGTPALSTTLDNREGTPGAARLVGPVVIRVIVPAFLIAGAMLKFLTATPQSLPIWITSLIDTFAGSAAQGEDVMVLVLRSIVLIELVAAGVILLVGGLARAVAVAVLGVFMLVLTAEVMFLLRSGNGFFAALTGSCGCFGKVTIPIWAEFSVNAVLFTCVAFLPTRWIPGERSGARTPSWRLALILIWLVAGIGIGMQTDFAPVEHRDWQRLSPNYWTGKNFYETPLMQMTGHDIAEYGGGAQTWIFYRKTCPTCHSLFREQYSGHLDKVVVAVHVPPGPNELLLNEPKEVDCPECQFIELPRGKSYVISTPLIIQIDESGTITEVLDPKLREFSKTHTEI